MLYQSDSFPYFMTIMYMKTLCGLYSFASISKDVNSKVPKSYVTCYITQLFSDQPQNETGLLIVRCSSDKYL